MYYDYLEEGFIDGPWARHRDYRYWCVYCTVTRRLIFQGVGRTSRSRGTESSPIVLLHLHIEHLGQETRWPDKSRERVCDGSGPHAETPARSVVITH